MQFLQYLIEHNLPVRNLVQSDFVVANEVVASYYDLADRTESGFRFVPIQHEQRRTWAACSRRPAFWPGCPTAANRIR